MFGHLTLEELLARWRADLRAASLGSEPRPGVTQAGVAAAQTRLGVRLPPSYLAFLRISDGLDVTGAHASGLRRLDEVDWFRDLEREWYEIWRDIDDESPEVALMARALLVSTPGDQALLLDPGDIDPATGEWACYTFSNWAAGSDLIGQDFRAILEYLYTGFLSSHDVPSPTRQETADAVEQAYRRMLAGDLGGRDQLSPRRSTSWRAALLAAQHDAFRGPGQEDRAPGLSVNHLWLGRDAERALADPVLTGDLVPYFTVRYIEAGWNLDHEIGRAPAPIADQLRSFERQIAEGSGVVADFSYCPPFARAAQQARELLAQDDDAGAWEVVRAALPDWTPRSSNHLVPLGLYYDKDLRRLLRRPRPRRLLPAIPPGTPGTYAVIGFVATNPAENEGPATVRRVHYEVGFDTERALTVLRTPFRPAPG